MAFNLLFRVFQIITNLGWGFHSFRSSTNDLFTPSVHLLRSKPGFIHFSQVFVLHEQFLHILDCRYILFFPFLFDKQGEGLLRIYLSACVLFLFLVLPQAAAYGKKGQLLYCLFGTWEGLFVYPVLCFIHFN